MIDPTPFGLAEMTNAAYHASVGYSKSHLDKVAISELSYWHHYLNPDREPTDQTDDLILGSATHSATLEPDLFNDEFKVLPDLDLRTKAGRAERDAFKAAHPGATIITVDQRKTALAIAAAVRRHPVAGRLFQGGKAEQSRFAVDPETGGTIKCRTDYFIETAGIITDLKTVKDSSNDGIAKSIANFRYDIQPPWYQDVFEALYDEAPPYWVFVFVEKTPPYNINCVYPTPEQIAAARVVARRDFLRILECKRTGIWRDHTTEIKPMPLPGWYLKNR